MKMTSLFTDHVSRSLGAAKNIYPTILLADPTKHNTAVTIVFFNELFEVKCKRGSWNNFFAGYWENLL